MGANGLIWVWWGVGVREDTKTKQANTKMGWQGMLGVHVWQGNFPAKNIHVLTDIKG